MSRLEQLLIYLMIITLMGSGYHVYQVCKTTQETLYRILN